MSVLLEVSMLNSLNKVHYPIRKAGVTRARFIVCDPCVRCVLPAKRTVNMC